MDEFYGWFGYAFGCGFVDLNIDLTGAYADHGTVWTP